MENILLKAKNLFLKNVDDFGSDPFGLIQHVFEAERWAKFMLNKYPEADKDVVLLSVWLHDIGHYPVQKEVDHSIVSEDIARVFLEKEGFSKERLLKVLHCIRDHRCKDVLPKTLEAKIVAFVDSASHMTDSMYLNIAKDDKSRSDKFDVHSKMKRDFRDLSFFPEVQAKLKGIFDAWKVLIKEYEKLDFV
jgi:hypothetical protein